MKIKAIMFDYDGVIHNTFGFHREQVKNFTGIDIPEDEFRDIHNGNFFVNKNNKLKDVVWTSYRDFIYEAQAKLKIEDRVKAGIITFNKYYDLYIVSSGGQKNISDCLDGNGLGGVFKEIIGLESHKSKVNKFNYLFQKYSLTPDECFFITDILGDILEANEVKIKTIAVDFGYHPKETLEKGKPIKIVSSFDALFETVRELTN